jgi:hypothetical protein
VSFPQLSSVPSTVFFTLTTVYASLCLASLFHPAATCGIHLSGGFPAVQVGRLVGGLYPLVVRLLSSHQRLIRRWPSDSNSWSPAFRALLQTAIRC